MFVIEKNRGNPVYLQIQSQLERLIAAGSLAPGAALPSVRTLAAQLRINPNTVVRAYRELEIVGLVETRQGEGSFVTADAGQLARASALIEKRAHDYVRDAKQLGLNQTEAIAAIKAAWRRGDAAEAS